MADSADTLVEQRLAAQRITSAPFADPVDAVRFLLCVQAQDAPLARYSVGLRVSEADDHHITAALDQGRILRTHILRPTWHFVAAEDLRWILALTSPKVESGLAGRHRQLGIDQSTLEGAQVELADMLQQRNFSTAPEIAERLAEVGHGSSREVVRHLLLVAELRGLVCSGPLRGSTHTYGLVDELVAPAPPVDRDVAIRELVHRFFAGHGPASEQDLRRWTTLTLTEIRGALAELGDVLEAVSYGDETLWFEAGSVSRRADRRRATLLPTFDEAYLPYKTVGMARMAGHPRGQEPHSFAEAGGGVVVVDSRDGGWWKRTLQGRDSMSIRLGLASKLTGHQRQAIEEAAVDMAAFFDRRADLSM